MPCKRRKSGTTKTAKKVNTTLHRAAQQGDLPRIRACLGQAIDAKDDRGLSPLFHACLGGHVEVAEFLLDAGADPYDAMHFAVGGGNVDMVRLLVNRGVDGNYSELLRSAAGNHRADMVAELLKLGADPNVTDAYYCSAIHDALRSDDEKSVLPTLAALLDGGADPNQTEGHGVTLLMTVSGRGWTEAARFLLNHRARHYYESCSSYWDSGLHWAIRVGQLATADFLAKRGAIVRVKYPDAQGSKSIPLLELPNHRDGYTPYLAACASRSTSVEMLMMLEKHGAKPQAVTQRKQNAWHLATNTCLHEPMSFPLMCCSSLKFQHLFKLGLPGMDKEDEWGKTPLHYSAGKGCVANISFLLLNGAEINHQNKNGMTPLAEAVEKIHPEAVKLLLKAGADPHIRYCIDNGSTRTGYHHPDDVDFRRWDNMGKPWKECVRAMRQAFDEAEREEKEDK